MRRHETDVVSLVFGLFFVGAAAVWGLSTASGHPGRSWALPVLLIVVGAVGLLTSLASRRPRSARTADAAQTADAARTADAVPTAPADPD